FNPGLPRALERLAPELVVVSGFVQPSSLLGLAWALARRRPYGLLVESHGLRPRRAAKRALRHALVRRIVRRAGVLCPTGEAAAENLAGLGGAPGRMARFPHVPDPALFHDRDRAEARAALRARLGLAADARVVAFVGRLVESKGVRTLLTAHEEVRRRTGARLVVAGSGPLGDELGSPREGVTFLGHVTPFEVAELLRAADLAVSPSVDEPWGTFPLEAAASGCPVVASDHVPSAVELA